ncbi:MAG: carbamoyl phosphate synthase large subunit [Magnetovibrio sp.]|nr:carbamoyl phosphate synthase large subunit [Magnetovibrio sp.]
MPKRTDIESVLIIGSGPIVIGQACEFDYSGVQACKALREEGYKVILVNSNPATIMTDPDIADVTYVEPITTEILEKIIEKDRPCALLPTMGGQTGLNTGIDLANKGVLERLDVEMIGADAKVIAKAEDRKQFRDAMRRIGLACPESHIVHDIKEAREALETIGLPAIIRPSFTLGGIGGGVAYNLDEYEQIVAGGLAASPTMEVLVEESVLGWKEFEMEVVRDRVDNCIIICSIENVDPMGVHTGDSITVAPALTLSDKEYQKMRNASIAVLREIGVDTGGSNVQFAVDPETGRQIVIEMNPRVSRSSALASKATGFPIAKIAAKLAIGFTLDELRNDITETTPASFEPTIDYVVTKIPRFTFEKFPNTEPVLTTSMKSVGEAMAIGRSFAESLQKALRSTETGLTGFNEVEIEGAMVGGELNRVVVQAVLSQKRPERIRYIAQAIRLGMTNEEIRRACGFDTWFLDQIRSIVEEEQFISKQGLPEDKIGMLCLKKKGFSDERLAELTSGDSREVLRKRRALGVRPVFKRVDTCAGEFFSQASFMYSSYEGDGIGPPEDESGSTERKKIVIIGGGPNRIGQGIEFDYCCVHAATALREVGIEAIMVNCNPETVSTDYDISDRLFFEPLTAEDVIELLFTEGSKGDLLGCIVQLGGQTPLKLTKAINLANIPILGTSPDSIDLAEDRERFQALLKKLDLRQPINGLARSEEEAIVVAGKIGYPLVIRPSYVLGGRAMEIAYDEGSLKRFMEEAMLVSGDGAVLLDSYLENAIEVDVDILADGNKVFIAGIMQHIEEAGVHSGDSACSLPPYSLPDGVIAEIERQATKLAFALNVVGLMNVQFAIKDQDIFILEANPRASRTVPFVAKATGVPLAKIAARVMAGERLEDFNLNSSSKYSHFAVKEAVFPFSRFPGVDSILGPEMKSTGEVMGIDKDFPRAFVKSQLGAGTLLPQKGTVFISVKDRDKPKIVNLARRLKGLGFDLMATNGTQKYLVARGLDVKRVNKVLEGRPHCEDALLNGKVQLVVNTTEGAQAISDSFSIRRSAVINNLPHYTTIAAAYAALDGIEAIKSSGLEVMPLQAYF